MEADFWLKNLNKPTRYFFFGDQEKARGLVADAKNILFQLKLMQNAGSPQFQLSKRLLDGSFIQVNTSVPGMDIVRITTLPRPKPIPEKEYFEENIFLVYDLVEADEPIQHYNGDHLAGFEFSPMAMDKNGPDFRSIDWINTKYNTTEGPLKPTKIKRFDHELNQDINWTKFSSKSWETDIYYIPWDPQHKLSIKRRTDVSVEGNKILELIRDDCIFSVAVYIGYYSIIYPDDYLDPGELDPYEGTLYTFFEKYNITGSESPEEFHQSGEIGGLIWCNYIYHPTDGGDGKESTGTQLPQRWAGAFSEKSGNYMVLIQRRQSDDGDPTTYFQGPQKWSIIFEDGTEEILEQEPLGRTGSAAGGCGSFVVRGCRIYLKNIYLLSYTYWEYDPDTYEFIIGKFVYYVWIKKQDGTRIKYKKEFDKLNSPYNYVHEIEDEEGNKYLANGSFRVVRKNREKVPEPQLFG